MTTSEYIKKKNKLFKKEYNALLVPKKQIIDVDIGNTKLYMDSDTVACPYCIVYLSKNCKGCPMFEANNGCKDANSTYSKLVNKIKKKDNSMNTISLTDAKKTKVKFKKLINKYNSELEVEQQRKDNKRKKITTNERRNALEVSWESLSEQEADFFTNKTKVVPFDIADDELLFLTEELIKDANANMITDIISTLKWCEYKSIIVY